MVDGQHVVNMILKGYLTEENVEFLDTINEIILRREFGNKANICDTQNYKNGHKQ